MHIEMVLQVELQNSESLWIGDLIQQILNLSVVEFLCVNGKLLKIVVLVVLQ
jgi:hypothetical protein